MKKKHNSIRIIDFGLACEVGAETFLYKRCGTPGFVAPEIMISGNEMKYN